MNSISPVKIWRRQKEVTSYLAKKGKIVSWSLIRNPPAGYEEKMPYPIVLVELEGDKRKIGQLVDWQDKDLRIGRMVKAVYRRIKQPEPEGVIPYGIKFKPIVLDI